MKQYVIDELRLADFEALQDYLKTNFGPPELGTVYWMPLQDELLNAEQAKHAECRPFYFALELQPDKLACELLVRTKNRVRCDCIGYANEAQREWLIRVIDAIFEKLEILT